MADPVISQVGPWRDSVARENCEEDRKFVAAAKDDGVPGISRTARLLKGMPVETPEIIKSLAPKLNEAIKAKKRAGWNIVYGEFGKGSFTYKWSKRIVIDPIFSGNGKALSYILAHEMGHALSTASENYSSPEDAHATWVQEEGRAVFTQVAYAREIYRNSSRIVDIGIPGNFDAKVKYIDILNRFYRQEISADEAHRQMGEVYFNTSCRGDGVTYTQAAAKNYTDNRWAYRVYLNQMKKP
jgi:hypothetical protein